MADKEKDDHELRIHDLENEVKFLKEKNKEHKADNKELSEKFDKLFTLLNKIRWIITGAVLFFLASEFGFVNIIKGYFT